MLLVNVVNSRGDYPPPLQARTGEEVVARMFASGDQEAETGGRSRKVINLSWINQAFSLLEEGMRHGGSESAFRI